MAAKNKKRKKAVKKTNLIEIRKRFWIGIGIVGFGVLVWLFWGIPLPHELANKQSISTKLFDRNGKLIYEIYTDRRSTPTDIKKLPQYVIDATISIEDKDFYKHHGFSISGIVRAIYKTAFKGKLEGGSTLTQQLVKNSLLTPERTIKRKIREFILSMIVEIVYSKDQILDMYLNQIPYGSTAYGIGAASELYFGKSAYNLSLAEAALLAGLPAAPTRYSPFGAHPEMAKERQELVLARMVEDKKISQEEAKNASSEELTYAQARVPAAPHFSLWVKDLLAEEYGDALVEQGGLRVTTTIDLELQEYAQQVVKDEVERLSRFNVGNGAVLVTKPLTGEILAMVGSKDYFAQDEDGKVNVIFARRQPGSSIKPLNYALAIRDKKITAATVLADVPTCFNVAGQEPYCPSNYDGQFHGAVQARFALGNSYNIPAVRVLALNGVANFVEFAQKMGITTFKDPSNYGLSLTLGGGEVTPYDMAIAFGVFANQGIKKSLNAIIKVEDWKGKVLKEVNFESQQDERILEPEVTFIINHILLDNNARSAAFGTSSYLNVPGHPEISVKTGTTNDRRDNWTVGYNSQVLAVSWVGNNDNSEMSGAVSGISGASPIWNKVIRKALDTSEGKTIWPKQPLGITGASICATTGGLPEGEASDCPQRFEYFLDGTVPSQNNAFRSGLQVDRANQVLANQDTPPEQIETQNHLIIKDPLDTIICLTCPFQMQPVSIDYH